MPVPFSNYKDDDEFKRYMARCRVKSWIQRISRYNKATPYDPEKPKKKDGIIQLLGM